MAARKEADMIWYEYINAIGQDSHRFEQTNEDDSDNRKNTRLILGGFEIPGGTPLKANSDGDVLLHALTNAISGITCVNVLGAEADRLCLEEGVRDSSEYVKLALGSMHGIRITHVSFSVECKTPKLSPHIENIRECVADLLGITPDSVGITATSGEGLGAFGKGEGIMVFCSVTARRAYGDDPYRQTEEGLPEL